VDGFGFGEGGGEFAPGAVAVLVEDGAGGISELADGTQTISIVVVRD